MPVPATDAAGKLMAKSAARGKQSQDDAAIYQAANSPSLRISILKKLIAESQDAYRKAPNEQRPNIQAELTALKSELAKAVGGARVATVPIDDDDAPEAVDLSHGSRGGFSSFVSRQNAKGR